MRTRRCASSSESRPRTAVCGLRSGVGQPIPYPCAFVRVIKNVVVHVQLMSAIPVRGSPCLACPKGVLSSRAPWLRRSRASWPVPSNVAGWHREAASRAGASAGHTEPSRGRNTPNHRAGLTLHRRRSDAIGHSRRPAVASGLVDSFEAGGHTCLPGPEICSPLQYAAGDVVCGTHADHRRATLRKPSRQSESSGRRAGAHRAWRLIREFTVKLHRNLAALAT